MEWRRHTEVSVADGGFLRGSFDVGSHQTQTNHHDGGDDSGEPGEGNHSPLVSRRNAVDAYVTDQGQHGEGNSPVTARNLGNTNTEDTDPDEKDLQESRGQSDKHGVERRPAEAVDDQRSKLEDRGCKCAQEADQNGAPTEWVCQSLQDLRLLELWFILGVNTAIIHQALARYLSLGFGQKPRGLGSLGHEEHKEDPTKGGGTSADEKHDSPVGNCDVVCESHTVHDQSANDRCATVAAYPRAANDCFVSIYSLEDCEAEIDG